MKKEAKDCWCADFLLELIDSTTGWVCCIAAGQYLYYHVSPSPLGNRSCCLHIYCIFVYSCPACILSPKLAHVSLFPVWVGGWLCCGSSRNRSAEKSLLLSQRIQFKRARDNKLLFSDICSKWCTVIEYKTSDVLQKIPDNGCKFFIWNTDSFYLFDWERMGMAVRIYLSSCSLAIRRALSPHALEAH